MKFTLIAALVTLFHFSCAYVPCVQEGENCITEPYNCCYGRACQETTDGWRCVDAYSNYNAFSSKIEMLNVIQVNECLGRGSDCAMVPNGCCRGMNCIQNAFGAWACQ